MEDMRNAFVPPSFFGWTKIRRFDAKENTHFWIVKPGPDTAFPCWGTIQDPDAKM